MKTTFSVKSFYFLCFLFLCIINSCAPNLIDKAKAFEKAYNSHDIERIVSFFADNIRFEVVGFFVKEGKKDVRELIEYDAAVNVHMIISDIKVNRNTVTFKLAESNDWFRLAGIEELIYEPNRIVFHDGLIKEIKSEITNESAVDMRKAWESVMEWALKERSQELEELLPGGKFIYNAESTEKWLVLLKEWKETTKQN